MDTVNANATKPRSIQEIFNAVIDAGYYDNTRQFIGFVHMCNALRIASGNGIITIEERSLALTEIRNYMEFLDGPIREKEGLITPITLAGSLAIAGLPYEFTDRLAIYRDWANRPMQHPPTTGK